MERHQAGQEETLMEVRMEKYSWEAVHRPRGSPEDRHGCFKCAVALAVVMGLLTVALVAFILYFFMFTPSCIQGAPLLNDTARNCTASTLKESDEGKYDIFTVDTSTNYTIFVWVKFSNVTSEMVCLWRLLKEKEKPLTRKNVNGEEIVFSEKKVLIETSRIYI
ncbi:hypothetical protein L3Q82_025916, partial [Scortum barcoo]